MQKTFLCVISLLFFTMRMSAQQTDPVSAQQTDPTTAATVTTTLSSLEQMPDFPGGQKALIKYLSENMEYPEEARKNGIEGKVLSQFMVNEDGTLTDVQIIGKMGYGCDEEVLRLITQMPRWNAGKEDGKAVKVLFKLPVVFMLGE